MNQPFSSDPGYFFTMGKICTTLSRDHPLGWLLSTPSGPTPGPPPGGPKLLTTTEPPFFWAQKDDLLEGRGWNTGRSFFGGVVCFFVVGSFFSGKNHTKHITNGTYGCLYYKKTLKMLKCGCFHVVFYHVWWCFWSLRKHHFDISSLVKSFSKNIHVNKSAHLR